jgi:hypothetical protein
MDPETGLMYGVQGASYNHNHCNGMAMELYGIGTVMGIDAGTGPTYEHPLHQTYYSQWAAHNTVVAAGASSSVPFSGSAGRKNIGQVELAAMEPLADRQPVSQMVSFTDTRYVDQSTSTNQMRTMAIIRTSPSSGYYVDIYRSDNRLRNDYVYHNIGDELVLMNDRREVLLTDTSKYPVLGKDFPGFRYFSDVRKLSGWKNNLIALFQAKDKDDKPVFMQLLVPAAANRSYYQAKSLKAKTASGQYSGIKLPVFTMVDHKQSMSDPFIAVFEPYRNAEGYTVQRIEAEKRGDGSNFTCFTVYNRNGSRQMILQSIQAARENTVENATFSGHFGVLDYNGKTLRSVYLGEGHELTSDGYSLIVSGEKGSASITAANGSWSVSCNQITKIVLPVKTKKLYLNHEGRKLTLPLTKTKKGVSFVIPRVNNATISMK